MPKLSAKRRESFFENFVVIVGELWDSRERGPNSALLKRGVRGLLFREKGDVRDRNDAPTRIAIDAAKCAKLLNRRDGESGFVLNMTKRRIFRRFIWSDEAAGEPAPIFKERENIHGNE